MIESFLQALLPSIEHFHSLAYWAAFVVAFAETALVVGLLVPGSTLLLLLGELSATGLIDFSGVFWFGVAGAVLGNNLNYWLGKRWKEATGRLDIGYNHYFPDLLCQCRREGDNNKQRVKYGFICRYPCL